VEPGGSCRPLVELGTAKATSFAGDLKPGVAPGPDGGPKSGEEVGRGDVTDRAVQADGVVVLDPAGDECASLVEVLGLTRPGSSDAAGIRPIPVMATWRCSTTFFTAPWARQLENQYLAVPRSIARELPERLQRMLGYDIHAPHMGHVDETGVGAVAEGCG
jgi:hypothetical protein